MFLNVDAGVTAGFVIGDEPYSGHAGLAGQIGHVRISDYGLPCRCGNRDCLDTVGSLPAMLSAYGAGHEPVTTERFLATARAGDPAALRIVEDAAEALGLAAAAAASIMNPRRIVLGGPLCALGPALLDPFRRSLVRAAGPGTGEAAEITLNTLGRDVAAVGAARNAARLLPET
jgi:predicted NBD/HSP70 family sugar kinase